MNEAEGPPATSTSSSSSSPLVSVNVPSELNITLTVRHVYEGDADQLASVKSKMDEMRSIVPTNAEKRTVMVALLLLVIGFLAKVFHITIPGLDG